MATIKDIARKLNISTSTVSYALNGGPRPVPDDVRERVLQTAKELDYRPNRLARTLITGRSYTMGVVPTQPTINLAYTPYFQGCFNGIVNEAEALGQDVMLFTRYDQSRAEAMANTLLDGRVDGLVFLAPIKGNPMLQLVQGRIPFVVVSGDYRGVPAFTANNPGGTRQAIRYLHELGHRRIAHIAGVGDMDDAVERRDAYRQAMADYRLPVPDGYVIEGRMVKETGYSAAKELLNSRPRPTAVFCANDEVALGLLQACRDLGVRVPQDLSVVGFDDAPLCAVVSPAVTTVKQPWDEMSRAATRALLAIIDNERQVTGRQFDTELIVRDSTASPQEDH